MSAMTKEEAAAHVNSIRRICRGPASKDAENISNKLLAGERLTVAETKIAVGLLKEEPGTTYTIGDKVFMGIAKVIEHDHLAAARMVKRAGRPGCGYDFNKTILSNPLDGKRRAYTCPQCGASGFYTPPIIEIEAA
ncbi:MAG: hypothetical protein NOU37_09295 [Candidatus Brocadiales bacterium]|nr:hypothetical protein [Candidatus Bathyanammoxibius amoris]